MGDRKYIILESQFGCESPILFGKTLTHAEVAAGRKVISAGFFGLSWNETEHKFDVSVYGRSQSLNVDSHPDIDAKMIGRVFND